MIGIGYYNHDERDRLPKVAVFFMIWSVPEILVQLSRYYALRAGDLVFTGTPAGVSSVVSGDRIQGGIEGVGEVAVELISGAGI